MSSGTSSLVTNSPADTLNWQAEQIRDNKFEMVGYIWKIVLEASRGAAVPQAQVAATLGSCMEWYGMENYRGKNYLPRIAQSRDRSSLLVLDPIKRVDGSVGLPDIPDPRWQPPVPTNDQLTGNAEYKPPQAPMLPQHLYEEDENHTPIGRARGQLKGTKFLVFGPVSQILVRPLKDDEMLPTAWILQCKANNATGKQMELLIHQETGQAFFYEGTFQIYRPG
jgi:hypothetical protein